MLKTIVVSGRIALGLLSVTLCTIVIAMRLGVPIAQITRGALSLVGERTLRHPGIEAKVLLASAPCSFDRMLVKAVALGWVRFEKAGGDHAGDPPG